MASLTAHLAKSGDHGRLGFHTSCPVCRQERLLGSLSSNAVISARAQAALASGVLAVSAVGPSVALAQEPNQPDASVPGQTGASGEAGSAEGGHDPAEPDPTGGSIPDPGGQVSPLGDSEQAPAPGLDSPSPNGDDAGSDLQDLPAGTEPDQHPGLDSSPPDLPEPPAEPKPPSGSDEPTASPESAPGDKDSDQREKAPTPAPPASDSNPQPEVPAEFERPAPPGLRTPSGLRAEESAETLPRDHSLPSGTDSLEPPTLFAQAPAVSTIAAPRSTEAPTATPSPAEPVATRSSSAPAPKDAALAPAESRVLVVQPGDSLWSIAKGLLGPDASPAQIARKVSHLWDLNHDRIGTGRPDLLLVGTKLELR